MSSIGHQIITPPASETYAEEAQRVFLRTLGFTNEPKTNIADIISGRQKEK